MQLVFVTLTSFAIGFLLMPIVVKFITKAKIIDQPGGRKMHKNFVPSMGGIGFFLAACISLAIWIWQYPVTEVQYLLGGIGIMFFVGLRDDLVELRASAKLLGQLIAVALVVVMGDIRITNLQGFLGIGELPLMISYGFTAFVLLALTNAFNLIDGIDGLAGSFGLLISFLLGIWFWQHDFGSYAVVCFSFFGGILAFLVFNWHPAKIFMGDTGSLTLGFTLGVFVVTFMEVNNSLPSPNDWKFTSTFSAGVALMIYPLYDMARVFIRRIRRGVSPMAPDKSHVHHFLVRMGLKHNQVVITLITVQLLILILIFAMKDFSDHIVLPLLSLSVISLGFLLDRKVLKYVKKKVLNEPNTLTKKKFNAASSKEIKIKDIEKSSINYN